MIIQSNLQSVIARQIKYGVYKLEEFKSSPYMDAYWSAHLIEELCEFTTCPIEEELKEAADVIIFLQNLTAYLYPTETLNIDLKAYQAYQECTSIDEVILAIRQYMPNRKSWKTYSSVSFIHWLNLVSYVLQFISFDYYHKDLEKAYLNKEQYNVTRLDWGN